MQGTSLLWLFSDYYLRGYSKFCWQCFLRKREWGVSVGWFYPIRSRVGLKISPSPDKSAGASNWVSISESMLHLSPIDRNNVSIISLPVTMTRILSHLSPSVWVSSLFRYLPAPSLALTKKTRKVYLMPLCPGAHSWPVQGVGKDRISRCT